MFRRIKLGSLQNLESLSDTSTSPKFEKQQNKVRKSWKVVITAGQDKKKKVCCDRSGGLLGQWL